MISGFVSTIIGVTLTILSEIFSSLANILIKVTHNQEEGLPAYRRTPPWRRKMWYFILFLYGANSGLNLFAFAFASLTVLAPISALTIPINMLLANWILAEVITTRTFIGTILLLSASALAVFVVPHDTDQNANVAATMDLFSETLFVYYTFAKLAVMIFCGFSLWLLHPSKTERLELIAQIVAAQERTNTIGGRWRFNRPHLWRNKSDYDIAYGYGSVFHEPDSPEHDQKQQQQQDNPSSARPSRPPSQTNVARSKSLPTNIHIGVTDPEVAGRSPPAPSDKDGFVVVETITSEKNTQLQSILSTAEKKATTPQKEKEAKKKLVFAPLNGVKAVATTNTAIATTPRGSPRMYDVESESDEDEDELQRPLLVFKSSPPQYQSPTIERKEKEKSESSGESEREEKKKEKSGSGSGNKRRTKWRKKIHDKVCCCFRKPQRKLIFRMLLYSVLTSGIASWTNMLAKAGVDMVSYGTEDASEYGKPLVWIVLVSVIPCAVLQLRLMAKMFSSFEAILVVPIFQSIFIFALILEGAFYFQDFAGITVVNTILFVLSLILCVAGVWLLKRTH